MNNLRKKLWRDLFRMRYQALTIALLVGSGVASLVASVAASASLRASRDAFYAESHFADIFVHLSRAPGPVLDRLRSLPGVAAVEGRVVGDYRLELEDSTEPIIAQFVSVSSAATGQLNEVNVLSGRRVEPNASDEVILSQAFAATWGIEPGARITAVINGHRAKLRVVGIGVSPEYVFSMAPRTGLPDARHFGVVWMDEGALAKSTGLVGAFNDALIQLAAGADTRETMHRIDTLLEPYGSLGAIAREDQVSARLVDQKIAQLAKAAVGMPMIFLSVAAFLLNVLMSRIVGTQREQIATLKALGYRTRELLQHYIELSMVICALGVVFGGALGVMGAKGLLLMYGKFIQLPEVVFRLDPSSVALGVFISVAAALSGTYLAVRKAVAIPPAEAMRPEAPQVFHANPVDRVFAILGPAVRMVLRDVLRRPVRLLLSGASIALATAIVVTGGAFSDSIDETLRIQFEVAHREDVSVTLERARPAEVVNDLAHVPGVRIAEGERMVPVRLRKGPLFKSTAILGINPGSDLHQLLGVGTVPLRLPPGLSLSRALGEMLNLHPGDEVEVEVLEGERQKTRVPVTALVDDLMGLSGYMSASDLGRFLGESPTVNVVLLGIEHQDIDAVSERLEAFPEVASVSRPELDRALVASQVADVFSAMQVMLALFAGAIAVGVVYNNARIALELRSRDLATLRILGFTRTELGVVLLGEQAIQLIVGVAPGLYLGRWISALTMSAIDRELMRIPPLLSSRSQVAAVCVVVLAALLSSLIVRRRSDHIDLVSVLKARD